MNISKKARVLSLLLCLLMVFTCLATACGEDTSDDDTPSTTAPVQGNKEATIENWVPITNYGVAGGVGQINYLIFDTYAHKYMLVQHEDSEDPLRSEAYSRTQKVEEKFNIYLNVLEEKNCPETLQSSIMGQGGEYDLVYPFPQDGATMMENHLLTDLCTYEYLHLDEAWWNQSVDTFKIDDRLYFAASDYSICGQGLAGLIYNRDLFKDLQLDQTYDINQLVENNQWTMEVLRDIAMTYGADVDTNDIFDYKDQYGMIYQNYHTNGYYWAMGGTIVTRDENNEYYLSIDVDRVSKMATALYNLIYSSEDKVLWMENRSWGEFEGSEGWKAYKTGKNLFMSFEFGALFSCLQTVTFDLGYAPLPLLDNNQDDYYSICGSGFFMIPKKSVDAVRNSIILEALCIDSYAYFRPAFFKTVLLGRLSNLEEDYAMLERLHESKVYDLGYTWSKGGASSLLNLVASDGDTQVASMIEANWREMNKTIEFIEDLRSGLYE